MEHLLAVEQAAEEHLHYLLTHKDQPIAALHPAFEDYRAACQATIFATFEDGASEKEAVLWKAHISGKQYFHEALTGARKRPDQPVLNRQVVRWYLTFLKGSQSFYTKYIRDLSERYAGIPELERIANITKNVASDGSSQDSFSPETCQKVLASCHHALICLGDLSRYRASEKLDMTPDFGPAIGYYSLACTLCPSSGMGHHQQAVIALGQQQRLTAILHLYRAIVVAEPHPNAEKNLKREFDKINAAWDRGELIQKGAPNDPDATKRTLVGWFTRLHGMCFKGELFAGFSELEREVLGHIAAVVKQQSLGNTLMRLVLTNMAAQWYATEKFKDDPVQLNQNAMLYFFRINIKTFTALLRLFYEDLQNVGHGDPNDGDIEDPAFLASRLTDTARRILPALRLYSSWLQWKEPGALSMSAVLAGLESEDQVRDAIEQFWPMYAKTLDLVAAMFEIWQLEDQPSVTYMLEEDADTLGFKPLEYENPEKPNKMWFTKSAYNTSVDEMPPYAMKPRFSDVHVRRFSIDEEMLERVRDFLADGLDLAIQDDAAPLKLQRTRILHRDAQDLEPPAPAASKSATVMAPTMNGHTAPQVQPLSYAAAAAVNGFAKVPALIPDPRTNAALSPASQEAQLSRMVDDLVDEDESNTPVTPPQPYASAPAAMHKPNVSRGGPLINSQGFASVPSHTYSLSQQTFGTPSGRNGEAPTVRTPRNSETGIAANPLQSEYVSSLWYNSSNSSSQFPAGLPMGTLGSPAQLHNRGHSRVNSASSNRSRTSQPFSNGIAESWSSIDSVPRASMSNGFGASFGATASHVASPLLFGASESVWSSSLRPAYHDDSPSSANGG